MYHSGVLMLLDFNYVLPVVVSIVFSLRYVNSYGQQLPHKICFYMSYK